MAARKDFASKKRRTSAPKRTTASTKAKPTVAVKDTVEHRSPMPKKKRPLKLVVASLVSIAVIALVLQQLMSIDPREIRESGISALIEQQTHSDSAIAETKQVIKSAPIASVTPTLQTPQKPTPTPTPTPKPKPSSSKQSASVVAAVPAAPTDVPVTDISTQAEQKEPFQFYKILAENSVETETIDAYKSTPKTAKLKQTTLLQTGSFRFNKDAQRMKARLLLNNLPNVKVSKTTSNNGTWYRVRTGPFATFNNLKAALIKLNKLNITPMQITLN